MTPVSIMIACIQEMIALSKFSLFFSVANSKRVNYQESAHVYGLSFIQRLTTLCASLIDQKMDFLGAYNVCFSSEKPGCASLS